MWTAGIQMKWVCDHRSESQFKQLAGLQCMGLHRSGWQSTAALTQRPRVRIPLKPRNPFFFFSCFFAIANSLRWSHTHFVYMMFMIPRRHFVSEQVIPDWVHSGFHAEWNCRSGMTFHSGQYDVNWKQTPFRDETANCVVWGERRMRIDRVSPTEICSSWPYPMRSCRSSLDFSCRRHIHVRLATVWTRSDKLWPFLFAPNWEAALWSNWW